jgi:hypothetical protein
MPKQSPAPKTFQTGLLLYEKEVAVINQIVSLAAAQNIRLTTSAAIRICVSQTDIGRIRSIDLEELANQDDARRKEAKGEKKKSPAKKKKTQA